MEIKGLTEDLVKANDARKMLRDQLQESNDKIITIEQ
jgi:hypothetical protein